MPTILLMQRRTETQRRDARDERNERKKTLVSRRVMSRSSLLLLFSYCRCSSSATKSLPLFRFPLKIITSLGFGEGGFPSAMFSAMRFTYVLLYPESNCQQYMRYKHRERRREKNRRMSLFMRPLVPLFTLFLSLFLCRLCTLWPTRDVQLLTLFLLLNSSSGPDHRPITDFLSVSVGNE